MMLAIDFGTSNSLAVLATREGVSAPLELDAKAQDPTVLRSLLYFPTSSKCFFANEAISEYTEHTGQGRFIRSIKKFLPMKSFMGSWIEDRVVKIEDLVGIFLLEVKKRAEAETGRSIERVLLGRPAQYSEDASADQLAVFRMRKAAEIAGFKDVHFFEEPLAAALDYRSRLNEWKKILVVDLGGGTSDFTVMEIGPGAFQPEHVLARGAISVAGDAVDGQLMADLFAPEFGSKLQYRVPMSSNLLTMPRSLLDKICAPADIAQLMQNDYMQFLKQVEKWTVSEKDREALRRLFVLCEDQLGFAFFEKIEAMKKTIVREKLYPFAFPYPEIELARPVPYAEFDESISHPTKKILTRMQEVLEESGLDEAEIDLVYCTGGSSRLARVQADLVKRFGASRVRSDKFFHSVIDGLGVRARQILES